METSTILVILLSILEVSLVFTFRKKKFDFGEFLSCQIPAVLQVGFLEYIFFEDISVSPWLYLAITGGSLLLFVIFADKEYKPKTTPGWMWFVAGSMMLTVVIPIICKSVYNCWNDPDFWNHRYRL